MKDDVSQLKSLGSKTTDYKYEGPSSRILETFENQSTRAYTVRLKSDEFTSLCPKTGQPDFATIRIEYQPKHKCVETKSLKLYLFAFRNEGSFMETITNRILNDLVEVLDPTWIEVTARFAPRGGIALEVRAESGVSL